VFSKKALLKVELSNNFSLFLLRMHPAYMIIRVFYPFAACSMIKHYAACSYFETAIHLPEYSRALPFLRASYQEAVY
jgi:hypothetical protein